MKQTNDTEERTRRDDLKCVHLPILVVKKESLSAKLSTRTTIARNMKGKTITDLKLAMKDTMIDTIAGKLTGTTIDIIGEVPAAIAIHLLEGMKNPEDVAEAAATKDQSEPQTIQDTKSKKRQDRGKKGSGAGPQNQTSPKCRSWSPKK